MNQAINNRACDRVTEKIDAALLLAEAVKTGQIVLWPSAQFSALGSAVRKIRRHTRIGAKFFDPGQLRLDAALGVAAIDVVMALQAMFLECGPPQRLVAAIDRGEQRFRPQR